jgi:hypothetical protein
VPFDEAKPSKQDDFSFSVPCGNDLYDEAKSLKPDAFPQTPRDGDPPVCAPADLSPVRHATPYSSPPAPSLALVPSLDPRPMTPESYQSENFPYLGPELTRPEIKKHPHAFIYSIFPRNDQAALRDRLREVLRSQWWGEGNQEPRGHLGSFVKRIAPKVFECQACGKKVFTSQYYDCFSL